MRRTHCGRVMLRLADNQVYFSRKCQVCGKVMTQRKRQPKNKSITLAEQLARKQKGKS